MKWLRSHDAPLSRPNPRMPRWGTLSLALPLALGVLGLVTIRPALSQEEMMRTLTVTGQGSESVETTQAEVNLGVEAQADSADEAQAEVARRSSAVVEFLRSRNVGNLETTGISLSPVYNYTDGERQIVGYQASNSVRFRVPTEDAGEIMDEAVRAGASRINGLQFIAADDAIANARNRALAEATRDAQTQANSVLAALGFSAQEVVSIQIDNVGRPPGYPISQRALAAEADAITPVIGGEQDVEARVTLQIRY